jgi:hypothetical protein
LTDYVTEVRLQKGTILAQEGHTDKKNI